MADSQRTFIPAATYDWLLPLYDPFSRLFGSAAAHRQLIEQAELQPGHRVLEIGCGTGSVLALIKSRHPSVDAVGLDPDPKALARTRRKVERLGAGVQLDRGFSDALPYPNQTFDRVFSALMFHHLSRDEKQRTLAEVHRVLKPTGSLHLLDFGAEHDHGGGLTARLFGKHFRDNSPHTILALMRAAGFTEATETANARLVFARIFYYRASVPRQSSVEPM
jgi:ubiquinone/menaquinone biosynthesis C-methylase UbiE